MDLAAFDALTDAQVRRRAAADPAVAPVSAAGLATMRRVPWVKRIRWLLRLSQEAFSERFHIPIGTLRDWEQGRKEPSVTAQLLLRMIEADPDGVTRIINQATARQRS